MHPVDAVTRIRLYNMVLALLFITLAAIVVAISMMRRRISFGSLIRSGIAREGAEHSRIAGPTRQFLVVVLLDGKIVYPRAMIGKF